MGLPIWLAAKSSGLGFRGGSFKGGDALEDALPMKSVLCHVGTSANTVSAERKCSTLLSPPAGMAAWASRGHHHPCVSKACSAQLVPRYVLCPERFGRAGMLSGHTGSGAARRGSWHGHHPPPCRSCCSITRLPRGCNNTGQARAFYRG